jgi:hypothetical protein
LLIKELNIYILKTVLAAEAHLAQGQWLGEETEYVKIKNQFNNK